MTPADRRELCAILRRVVEAMSLPRGRKMERTDHALTIVRACETIDRIEKEIERGHWYGHPVGCLCDGCCRCRSQRGEKEIEQCPTPTSETSGVPAGSQESPSSDSLLSQPSSTGAALTRSNPPDLDAIRKAVDNLEAVLDACGYDEDEYVPPWAVAARRVVALDVPAVVGSLQGKLNGLRTLIDVGLGVGSYPAEEHERSQNAEIKKLHDERTKAEQERDAARKERDEARDKALEEAAVVVETELPYGNDADEWAAQCLRDAAAAIRAMKGHP